ncbi:MAG: YceI family protein [Myxococcota bacterium]
MTKLAVLVTALAVSSVANATTYKVADGSQVGFLARITGGTFTATNKAVSGHLGADENGVVTEGAIIVKADAFSTGIGMRDSHMREKYLEASKCPVIALDLKGATLPTSGEAEVEGTMEAHCVKKPLKVRVKVVESGGVYTASSNFPLDITQFGIPQPKMAVVKMDPTIDVTVSLRFTK